MAQPCECSVYAQEDHTKVKDRRVIILLGSSFFAAVSVNYIISPVLPTIARTFAISISQAGMLVSIYSLTYACAALVFGPISDLFGRKRLMVVALLLFSGMTFLCGVAKSFMSLALFRALAGVAAAMLQPATWGYLGDYFVYQRRGTATAWVMQAGSVAVVLGVPLGGLMAFYINWHGIFIAASLLSALIAVLVLLLLPSLQTVTSTRGKPKVGFLLASTYSAFHKLFTNETIRASLAVSFLIWFGFQGQYTYVGAYLDHTYGLDSAKISFITLTLGLGYILGGQLGGRLSDRFGRKWIILIGLTFLTIVLGILPSVQQLPIAIFGIFAMGFGFFFTYSAQVTLMTELLPEARGTTMSANYFFTYIGLTAGSVVGGLILAQFDFPQLGYMSAVACVLAGVIAYRYVFKKASMNI